MSGHSKWSNIKRKKAINDLAQAKVFAKLSKQITLAVVEGGGMSDPEYNLKLRLAITRAKAENLPKENILRAIKKGEGIDERKLEKVIYEGFAPGGVVLLIVVMTSNRNKTLPEIKHVLENGGGKFAENGSVNYLFKKCGRLIFDREKFGEDDIFKLAEKFFAFDIIKNKRNYFLYIDFQKMGRTIEMTKEMNIQPPEIFFKPNVGIKIDDQKEKERVEKLVAALEELDDVRQVFTNLC